ncbi:MAG: PAS domain-containing protein [Candidatus Eisenbacteria sp.]|nr:PAS domain-containing protein [Candidatus Eisenbacteria bacterium]
MAGGLVRNNAHAGAGGEGSSFVRVLLLMRLGVFTLALGGTGFLLLSGQGADALFSVGALLIAAYIVSGLYWVAYRQGYRSRFQVYGPILIDIVVNTWIVQYSGGIESPFALLYILTILSVGAVFQTRPALVAATVSAVCFGCVGWLEYSEVLSPGSALGANLDAGHSLAYVFFYIVLQVGFFYMTAVGSGALSGNLKAKGEALQNTAAELQEMRHDTESILQNMPSGLVSVNDDRVVVGFNRAAGEMLGLNREHAVGREMGSVLGPGYEGFREVVERVFATGSHAPRLEITIHRPDVSEIPLGISASVLRDPGGESRGVIAVFQDLTEVHRMRAQIRRSDKLAAVGELSTAIAHELRNPLASIGGCVELLQSELNLSDENERLMSLILKESMRLKRITSEFLDFASVREKRIRMVDLGEVLREVACLLRGYDRFTESVDLIVNIEEEARWIEVDEEQFKQVLLNLGYNALDAMGGNGCLRVHGVTRSACTHDAVGGGGVAGCDRGNLVLTVEDTGCGIPLCEQEKVFEPFYSSKPRGVGLGLSIVSRIVEDHGGKVLLESKVDCGTCLTVFLQRCVAARGPARESAAEQELQEATVVGVL